MKEYQFVNMTNKHRQEVVDIYNYYVENSFAAYPTELVSEDIFTRFKEISNGFPAKVVQFKDDKIVGFAFLHAYHKADSFNKTAEITYFISPEHTRKGLASLILDNFINEARKMGIKNILANISSLNTESLNFHKKHGFTEVGHFKSIGTKFEQNFDVIWMQYTIDNPNKNLSEV